MFCGTLCFYDEAQSCSTRTYECKDTKETLCVPRVVSLGAWYFVSPDEPRVVVDLESHYVY